MNLVCQSAEGEGLRNDRGDEEILDGHSGRQRDKVERKGAKDVEGYEVVYSGIETGRARVGVVIVFSEEMTWYVNEWNCVDERIVVVRFADRREMDHLHLGVRSDRRFQPRD